MQKVVPIVGAASSEYGKLLRHAATPAFTRAGAQKDEDVEKVIRP